MPQRRATILSVEQALAMPYATLRFVHLGWRVIRVEPTPAGGRQSRGDPNRYIGRKVAGDDRHSYFVAPNVGKEAVVLNLKEAEGRDLLYRILRELRVDIFCTNTMPARHKQLGIDYETLRAVRDDLIWCSISAMGCAYPDVPGYDPAIQALSGYMDLTGMPDGPPTQCGPPVIDLKAGDEAFTQMLLALLTREQTGRGSLVDVSMAHAAVSWLQTFLPMLDMGSPPSELRRSGNEHRQFIPVNAYETSDGFIYMALGSDAQWQRFVKHPTFRSLDDARYAGNEGRRANRAELHASIANITKQRSRAEVSAALTEVEVPHAPISAIEEVVDLPFVKDTLLTTTTPDGRTVRLPPPAVETEFLREQGRSLRFAPSYGENTEAVLLEAGVASERIGELRSRGVIQ